MQFGFLRIVLLLSGAYVANALKELPERARGGRAYEKFISTQKVKHNVKSQVPQTWDAPMDHFSTSNNATFVQRYYVNDEFWEAGEGPVFFEISGEGTLTGPPGGYMETLAVEYGALLIALEHRFYGESIPNGNLLTENYNAYLSVQQALGDLASFTDYYKGTVDTQTDAVPWVVFGGSYAGGLSAWYRTAYPDHSVLSLSSSGVTNCIIDFYQFDMQVSAAAGNECGSQIKLIQEAFHAAVSSESEKAAMAMGEAEGKGKGKGSTGLDFQYAKDLFYCEADMAETDFYYMIADSWSMMIQYDGKTEMCEAIVDITPATPYEQRMQTFADFSNLYWGTDFCSGGFYNTKQLADPLRWETNSRSWRYQTCAQVSYFNTAPESGSLRDLSVNLDYHLQQCEDIFGQKMFPSSKAFNEVFGADFPHAERVFYSDFSDDPWQRASVWFSPSDSQPYHLSQCDNCGHCMDLHTPSESDPLPLQQSRQEFENYLQLWLKDAAASKTSSSAAGAAAANH